MDGYLVITILGAVVVPTVLLRVFFTLWGPVDRRLNPTKPSSVVEGSIPQLLTGPVNVHFTSGSVLENVVFTGSYDGNSEEFYELDQMLVLHGLDGRDFFVRASQVEYFEQAPAAPHAPTLPQPGDPETWE